MNPITGKSTKKDIRIDSELMDLEVFTKRAKVTVDDLMDDYFRDKSVTEKNTYKIAGCRYEVAEAKMGIVNDYLCEVLKTLKGLQEFLNGEGAER